MTTSPHELSGVIDATTNFDYFSISYEASAEPGKWITLVDRNHTPVKSNGKIITWDLSMIPSGQITLKIYLHGTNGGYSEKKYRFTVSLPTLTPTATATSTATPTFVPPTITPTNTNIPVDTPTPTHTPIPTETPTPTETPIPEEPTLTP